MPFVVSTAPSDSARARGGGDDGKCGDGLANQVENAEFRRVLPDKVTMDHGAGVAGIRVDGQQRWTMVLR